MNNVWVIVILGEAENRVNESIMVILSLCDALRRVRGKEREREEGGGECIAHPSPSSSLVFPHSNVYFQCFYILLKSVNTFFVQICQQACQYKKKNDLLNTVYNKKRHWLKFMWRRSELGIAYSSKFFFSYILKIPTLLISSRRITSRLSFRILSRRGLEMLMICNGNHNI